MYIIIIHDDTCGPGDTAEPVPFKEDLFSILSSRKIKSLCLPHAPPPPPPPTPPALSPRKISSQFSLSLSFSLQGKSLSLSKENLFSILSFSLWKISSQFSLSSNKIPPPPSLSNKPNGEPRYPGTHYLGQGQYNSTTENPAGVRQACHPSVKSNHSLLRYRTRTQEINNSK